MEKTILLSFASSNIKNASERFFTQAKAVEVFDEIIINSEHDLDEDFRIRHAQYLKWYIRGFGYWAWKPQIIAQTLRKMKSGEILCYCDIGCHINSEGKQRLIEYLEILENTDNGILAFQNKKAASQLEFDDRHFTEFQDYQWTKGDVLRYFDVLDRRDITHTPTIGAGIIFIKKNEFSEKFVNKWLKAVNTDFRLIDDSPSMGKNVSGFIENRHDQALFSILAKLHHVKTLSSFEYWYPSKQNSSQPDWLMLKNYPFHAKRDIKISLTTFIVLKMVSLRRRIKF
jgi:hypothetical protein